MKHAKRLILMPVRLMLGLPPIYGLTIKCWALYQLRKAGLYRGTIDFVAIMPTLHAGASVNRI